MPATVINAPNGALVWVVSVNEWGYSVPSGSTMPSNVNTWDTSLRATIPTSATYGSSTVVTGVVTADRWECFGHPPQFGPSSGPPAYRSTPSALRRVALEGRNTPTSAWYTVTSTLSGAAGDFRLSVRSPGTRDYRVLVLGAAKPPSPDPKAAEATAAGHTVASNRVMAARFDDPSVRVGSQVTARLTMAARTGMRTTLERWNGSAWVPMKWVYLREGAGSYTFTATARGAFAFRFVIPATLSPEGLPILGTSSPAFSYTAS